MARFPSSRCSEGSRHEQRLRISLVKLQKKYEVNQSKTQNMVKQKESMMFYQEGYLLVRRLNPSDFFDQEGFQERFDSDPSLVWVARTRR